MRVPNPAPRGPAQGRGPTNPALERGEAERLFRDYVQDLLDAANEAYLDLLDAVIAVGGPAGRLAV